MTTIDQIKQELRDIIELSDKATPAPWEHGYGNPIVLIKDYCIASTGNAECVAEDCPIIPFDEQVSNSELIAASRNLTPKMARALLTAIEALEAECPHGCGPHCPHERALQSQLETIRREWEGQA